MTVPAPEPITAEQIAAVAATSKPFWWWMRADNTVYATAKRTPETEADIYLLRAPRSWLDQWNGDWQAAADQINEALSRRDQEEVQ